MSQSRYCKILVVWNFLLSMQPWRW